MSMHRSLKTKPSALNQHRNVLTRAERLRMLMEAESFDPESDSPIGLPKVANRKTAKKKKEAKAEGEEKIEETEGTEGEAAADPGS